MTYGGSWYSRCLSRSITRLSHDRDIKFMSKLVPLTAPFSKKLCWIPLNWLVEFKQQLGELKDKISIWLGSFSKGCLVFLVLKQDSVSFMDLLSPQPFIWVWAIVKSFSERRTIFMVLCSSVSPEYTSCHLVWPILSPCSYYICIHLLGVSW